jgi:hypothetical protein
MLERLQKLNPAIVVPGHGEIGDASLITTMHEYLVFVRDRVQQVKSQGNSMEDGAKNLREKQAVLGKAHVYLNAEPITFQLADQAP